MQAIWKYPLSLDHRQVISLPVCARILCVQVQNEVPCIWIVNKFVNDKDVINRTFIIYGTGHIHEQIEEKYIGTFQMSGGALVFHLFEE